MRTPCACLEHSGGVLPEWIRPIALLGMYLYFRALLQGTYATSIGRPSYGLPTKERIVPQTDETAPASLLPTGKHETDTGLCKDTTHELKGPAPQPQLSDGKLTDERFQPVLAQAGVVAGNSTNINTQPRASSSFVPTPPSLHLHTRSHIVSTAVSSSNRSLFYAVHFSPSPSNLSPKTCGEPFAPMKRAPS